MRSGRKCGGAALVCAVVAVGCDPSVQRLGSVYVKAVDVSAATGATIEVSATDSPELAGTRLVIPAGALEHDLRVTLSLSRADIVASPGVAAGPVAVWGPAGTTFRGGAQLTLPLALPAGASTRSLYLAISEESGERLAIEQPALTVAAQQGSTTATIVGFSSFQNGAHPAEHCVLQEDCAEGMVCLEHLCIAVTERPVAIARLPGSTCGTCDVEPLARVQLDGTASFDPADPDDSTLIAAYQWEIIDYPAGTSTADFAPEGESSSLFSFWIPLTGRYEVRLTVWNTEGIRSEDTAEARVAFDVAGCIPFHVQLTWDNATNDQDLHLVYTDMDPAVCSQMWDCYFNNPQPVWFDTIAAATGPNPLMDVDDVSGFGPESIIIRAPAPGSYRVFVHYWSDLGTPGEATRSTVRIYLQSAQVAEYRRTLSPNQLWAVADIVWADCSGTVTPYPADAAGETGALAALDECSPPGFVFP